MSKTPPEFGTFFLPDDCLRAARKQKFAVRLIVLAGYIALWGLAVVGGVTLGDWVASWMGAM